MSQFQAEMPQELRFDGLDPDSGRGIWTAMLNMSYKYVASIISLTGVFSVNTGLPATP